MVSLLPCVEINKNFLNATAVSDTFKLFQPYFLEFNAQQPATDLLHQNYCYLEMKKYHARNHEQERA